MPKRGPESSKGGRYDHGRTSDDSNSSLERMPRERERERDSVDDVAQRMDQFHFRGASSHDRGSSRPLVEYITEEQIRGNQRSSEEESWMTYNDAKGEGVKYTSKGKGRSTRDISLFT